jgi:hypothetical protein
MMAHARMHAPDLPTAAAVVLPSFTFTNPPPRHSEPRTTRTTVKSKKELPRQKSEELWKEHGAHVHGPTLLLEWEGVGCAYSTSQGARTVLKVRLTPTRACVRRHAAAFDRSSSPFPFHTRFSQSPGHFSFTSAAQLLTPAAPPPPPSKTNKPGRLRRGAPL